MEELDIHDANKAFGMAIKLNTHAREYLLAREKAANAKHSFDIILASRISDLSSGRRNLGHETATILVLNQSEEIRNIYKEYLTNKAKADGLEKVIDAIQTQISLYQSICKNLPK